MKINYVPRHQNCVADKLAKRGIDKSEIFDHVPFFLKDIVHREIMGAQSPNSV